MSSSSLPSAIIRDVAADLVVDCAPLFEERYLLNREAVRQGRPMVECAVYELEAHLTTVLPGETPCLRCLYPEASSTWRLSSSSSISSGGAQVRVPSISPSSLSSGLVKAA